MIYSGDIETWGASDKFICGTWCYRDTETKKLMHEVFTNKNEYEKWIIEEAKRHYSKTHKEIDVYFHNLGFDAFRYMDLTNKNYIFGKKEGYKIRNLSKKTMIDYLDINGRILINYQDTMKLFPKSLEEIGQILGIGKLKPNERLERKFHQETKIELTEKELNEIKEYNIRDAEICYLLVEKIQEILEKNENYKPWKILTIGQLSMGLYNKRIRDLGLQTVFFKWQEDKQKAFVSTEYEPTQYPLEILKACRSGRIEANKVGDYENCTNIDYNSLYPMAMCQMPMPNLKTEQKIELPLEVFTEKEILQTIGISNVELECPKQEIGYLPIRLKMGSEKQGTLIDETIYPTHKCKLIGTWTNYELLKAIELGYQIKKINWTIFYKQIKEENPLKIHLMDLYSKRKLGKIENTLYKGLMNNIHGKFAQRNNDNEYIMDDADEKEEYEKKGFTIAARFGTNYLYSKLKGKIPSKTYAPIISAYCTAYARDIMYRKIQMIGPENYLYCGTDSILFTPNKPVGVIIGTEMGEFKYIEHNGKPLTMVNATIYGKNNYLVGTDKRISGVHKKQTKEMTKEQLETEFKYDKFKSINDINEITDLYERKWDVKDLMGLQRKTEGLKKYIKTLKVIEDAGEKWKDL